ncbi:hypothetical protein G6F50_017023 [Rhizopus delemar]|uniref:ABC transporter domain-containing protein n=1 Tax=Rhizopus delemar TaxID=936053 RepID=A0A9P6XRH7_9FUNG|nr:hypothetical protein G6F50_017023 [Rhizopus delemar]
MESLLEELQIGHIRSNAAISLSGGERRRVEIARALATSPRFILLDEPFSALDSQTRLAISDEVVDILRREGKTVVLVLHDINFASSYADRIVAMRQGRIAHQGTPAELIRAEVLSPLYELPIDVHEIGGKRICVYYR